MNFEIEKQGEEIVIHFEEVGGNAQAVVDAIGRCRVNSWTCSSGECAKIGSMESCAVPGSLTLRLRPRTDLSLDVATLGKCLKHQLPEHLGTKK